MSLAAVITLYAAFLFPYHIYISAKTPEALSAKDKHKKQEINETVEGNSLKTLGFAWLFIPCAFVINQCVRRIALLNGK